MLNLIIKIECLGQYEQPIIIHKFRSMYLNSDRDFSDVSSRHGLDSLGKIINDPRITPIGKIMRRYFIDELPQFYDLNRGVISLVGIRPKTLDYWKKYPVDHMKRALKFKPGLFGVHYYYNNLRDSQDFLQTEQEYLSRKERENPERLDREYLRGILKNIFFKGLRSR